MQTYSGRGPPWRPKQEVGSRKYEVRSRKCRLTLGGAPPWRPKPCEGGEELACLRRRAPNTSARPGRQVINEYESGKAIPNNAIIAKIERALGAKLPRAPKK